MEQLQKEHQRLLSFYENTKHGYQVVVIATWAMVTSHLMNDFEPSCAMLGSILVGAFCFLGELYVRNTANNLIHQENVKYSISITELRDNMGSFL